MAEQNPATSYRFIDSSIHNWKVIIIKLIPLSCFLLQDLIVLLCGR